MGQTCPAAHFPQDCRVREKRTSVLFKLLDCWGSLLLWLSADLTVYIRQLDQVLAIPFHLSDVYNPIQKANLTKGKSKQNCHFSPTSAFSGHSLCRDRNSFIQQTFEHLEKWHYALLKTTGKKESQGKALWVRPSVLHAFHPEVRPSFVPSTLRCLSHIRHSINIG